MSSDNPLNNLLTCIVSLNQLLLEAIALLAASTTSKSQPIAHALSHTIMHSLSFLSCFLHVALPYCSLAQWLVPK